MNQCVAVRPEKDEKMPDQGTGEIRHILGRLEGQFTALETRVSRHEDAVWKKLNAIEAKLDEALTTQAQAGAVFKFGHWLLGGAGAAAGWLASHISFVSK